MPGYVRSHLETHFTCHHPEAERFRDVAGAVEVCLACKSTRTASSEPWPPARMRQIRWHDGCVELRGPGGERHA